MEHDGPSPPFIAGPDVVGTVHLSENIDPVFAHDRIDANQVPSNDAKTVAARLRLPISPESNVDSS
jgi:hypothetical protein